MWEEGKGERKGKGILNAEGGRKGEKGGKSTVREGREIKCKRKS